MVAGKAASRTARRATAELGVHWLARDQPDEGPKEGGIPTMALLYAITCKHGSRDTRKRPGAAAPRAAPDLDCGSVWMTAVGVERVFFTCRADCIDSPLKQIRESFPGQPVSSACAVV